MSVPPPGSPVSGTADTTPSNPNGAPRNPQPDPPSGTQPPTMQTLSAKRHDELLQILKEADALPPEALMQSDLPEQADRLLAEINASRPAPGTTARTKRFQLFDKHDSVNRLLAKLEVASRCGNIPTPYPIDHDPLALEAWTALHDADDVAAVAKAFPQLRSALCVYLDDSGTNHLARTFHAGKNIDFDIDLRAKKVWRLFPAYDAIHNGPAANFIVMVKIMLFLTNHAHSIPLIAPSLKEFIDIRTEDEIASLIQHCQAFSWPDTVAIVPESKEHYVAVTRDNPIEEILFDLIAPIIAIHPKKSTLLSLMADVNPSSLTRALSPLNFIPTDTMIANAKTSEARDALRRLKNPY